MKMDERNIETIKRIEELRTDRDVIELKNLRNFRLGLYPMRNNYRDLKRTIRIYKNPENRERIWDNVDNNYRWNLQKEINRNILNFLSAAYSLREYTYKKVKALSIEIPELKEHYQDKVTFTFTGDPESNFVMDLRRYYIHHQFPQIGVFLHLSNQFDGQVCYPYLHKKELENFEDWNVQSTKVLDRYNDKVEFEPIMDSYFTRVLEFQDWFLLQIYENRQEMIGRLISKMETFLEEGKDFAIYNTPFRIAYVRYLKMIDNRLRD